MNDRRTSDFNENNELMSEIKNEMRPKKIKREKIGGRNESRKERMKERRIMQWSGEERIYATRWNERKQRTDYCRFSDKNTTRKVRTIE